MNKINLIKLLDITNEEINLGNLFEEMKNEFSQYDSSLWIACGIGLSLFIVLLILACKGIIFSDRKLKIAKEKGYIIMAKLISSSFSNEEDSSGYIRRVWTAVYEYEFKGRKGRKRIITHYEPGDILTLYHNGKSSKVYTEAQMKGHRLSFLIIYILPIIITIIIAKLLGYQS